MISDGMEGSGIAPTTARLESRLKGEGRPYLKWKVEDGWEPLCEVLGKEVPDESFPSGNTPRKYEEKMGRLYLRRRAEAERNLRVVGGVVILAVAGGLGWIWMGR